MALRPKGAVTIDVNQSKFLREKLVMYNIETRLYPRLRSRAFSLRGSFEDHSNRVIGPIVPSGRLASSSFGS